MSEKSKEQGDIRESAGLFSAWCDPQSFGPRFTLNWSAPNERGYHSVSWQLTELDDLIGVLTRLSNECQKRRLKTRDERRYR